MASVLLRLNPAPTVADDAAGALRRWSGKLSRPSNPGIQSEQLVELPAGVAAELIIVSGFCGPERLIDDVASRLATSTSRRVYLVLLALAVSKSYPDMFDYVVNLLPAKHPVLELFSSEKDVRLSSSVLDDLGDARAVREVVLLLPQYFT